jgi:hypothetical protein
MRWDLATRVVRAEESRVLSARMIVRTSIQFSTRPPSSTPHRPPLHSTQLLSPCFSSAPLLSRPGVWPPAPSPAAPSPRRSCAVRLPGAVIRYAIDPTAGDDKHTNPTPSVLDGFKKLDGM